MIRFVFVLLLFGLVAGCEPASDSIVLKNWRVSEALPGQNVSVGYGIIENNTDVAVTLMGVSSGAVQWIEMHQNSKQGDMMQMMEVESIEIAAKSQLVFETSGYHLMVFEMDSKTVQLQFEFDGQQPVSVGAELFKR